MSVSLTVPNISKHSFNTLSEGFPEFSVSFGSANQEDGKLRICIVSGLSPGFISFIFLASLKNVSQSFFVGKTHLVSAALTVSDSLKPLIFIFTPSNLQVNILTRLLFFTSPKEIIQKVSSLVE